MNVLIEFLSCDLNTFEPHSAINERLVPEHLGQGEHKGMVLISNVVVNKGYAASYI